MDIQPKQDQYEVNTKVTLTAIPDTDNGWEFGCWEGSGFTSSINSNINLIMDSDKIINSVFGQVLLQDDFSDDSNSWTEENTTEKEKNYTQDGKYAITAKKSNWNFWEWPPIYVDPEDYYVEYDFEFDGILYTEMLLIFNFQDIDNYYIFKISIYGGYDIYKQVNGVWNKLVDWTKSDFINKYSINKIAMTKLDNKYYFYVNDNYLDSITVASDTVISYMGIGVGSSDDVPVTVKFDNFKYLNLSPDNQVTAALSKPLKSDFSNPK